MEDSVKQRLMKFLRYKDISNSVFEKTCGMANGYVNNIRVGVSPKKLESILLNYPELNRDWLIYGEGDMLNEGYTTFDPVGVATPTAPNLENEIILLKAQLEEKEKMIALLQKQLAELNELHRALMSAFTNVVASGATNKKVAEG